jgi:protein-S-isoprenylcysteine O-methyltransferase Ste14
MKRALTLAVPFPLRTQAPSARVRVGFDPVDLAARCGIVALFTLLAVRIGADAMVTGRVTGLLLLASESLVVVLTVVRRTAGEVDRTLRARLVTGLSMLGPLMVRPASVAPLLTGDITVAASAFGLSIVIAGKLTIGRSFGLLPANRGIVSSGIYGLVRHPIYAGYLITHVAYLAANPSVLNAVLLVTGDLALLRRAVCEEATLARDSDYRSYMERVRWRICPGVF